MGLFGEKTREVELTCKDGYIGRRMLRMELPRKRKLGRPKGGLWMWGKRTWLMVNWRMRIQKLGTTGYGESACCDPCTAMFSNATHNYT